MNLSPVHPSFTRPYFAPTTHSLRKEQTKPSPHLQGKSRVVILAALHDVPVRGVRDVVQAENQSGDGEQDEAQGFVVDAENEPGAIAVEALVNHREGGERLRGEGGETGGKGDLGGERGHLGDDGLGDCFFGMEMRANENRSVLCCVTMRRTQTHGRAHP